MVRGTESYLILSSGRTIYANGFLLSVPAFGELRSDEIHQGYDGVAYFRAYIVEEHPLTEAERREIAEHMIDRWREWGGI